MITRSEYMRQYYLANKERIKERNKAYYHARRAQMTPEELDEWRARHREYSRLRKGVEYERYRERQKREGRP